VTPRSIVLILAAILTAGGTIYFVQGWLNSERAAIEAMRQKPAPAQVETQVLVAKQSLPAGLLVKPEHLRWQIWPSDSLPANYVIRGKAKIADFAGTVVRRGIAAGEPITDERLVKKGERGFLAAVLTPGMRAITVSVNPMTGLAGLVFPGDRVDLLLTMKTRRKAGKNTFTQRSTETILTGIRVLAVDQRSSDGNGKPALAKTATLEVTPKQVEMVSVATEMGRLSLSLRSLTLDPQPVLTADSSDVRAARMVLTTGAESEDAAKPKRGRSYTLDSQVSRLVAGRGPTTKRNQFRVQVVRGNKSQRLSFNANQPYSATQMPSAVRGFTGATAQGLRTLGSFGR